MKRSKPKPKAKVVWANGINAMGLYSKKPIRCVWDDSSGYDAAWWDARGDFDVSRLGYEKGPMDIFASENRADVELWTAGANAILDRLREWAGQ